MMNNSGILDHLGGRPVNPLSGRSAPLLQTLGAAPQNPRKGQGNSVEYGI